MRNSLAAAYLMLAIAMMAAGCVASRVGSATKEEWLDMKIAERSNVINSELVQ